MKKIMHKANSRGFVDHGWLKSHHTFSFASYHNPERVRFGLLRVINDDWVAGGKGFDTHPHDNMEIVTVMLSGTLRHKDSMGNNYTITGGEVQAMSAGTGITHSEYNDSPKEDVSLLQIWVFPKVRDVTPTYAQKEFSAEDRLNKFQTLVAPDERNGAIHINQDAFFSRASLDAGKTLKYQVGKKGNGIYAFVIDGKVDVSGESLATRDAIGVFETEELELNSKAKSDVLVIEVPMHQ